MLNKLQSFIRQYDMVQAGDTVICAVSGGADSVALLFGMYLLKDKLNIRLEAAHFNHGLRADESLRDEAFVKNLCARYDIRLHIGRENVQPGKKGLEAAARNARYNFLKTLQGKIATAHTADDNAETVLMHMLRGTGLKGLGGITPNADGLIRPMLNVTRDDVIAFLEEYHLSFVTDSSNESDRFLRNRVRHHVMPLLHKENPQFADSISQMALRLRQDETELMRQAIAHKTDDLSVLRDLRPAIRSRVLALLLEDFGVSEPASEHISLLEALVYSGNPSATADFPGNIKIGRVYDRIAKINDADGFYVTLPIPGELVLEDSGVRVVSELGVKSIGFSFVPDGTVTIRSRKSGDEITLSGGTKSLKKVFIDRKIPKSMRNLIPVIADDGGVVAACGVGVNTKREDKSEEAVTVWFEKL